MNGLSFLLSPYRGLFFNPDKGGAEGGGDDSTEESTPSVAGDGKNYQKLYETQLKSYATLQGTHTALQDKYKVAKESITTLQDQIGELTTSHSTATKSASDLEAKLTKAEQEKTSMKVNLRRKELLLDPKYRDLADFEHGGLIPEVKNALNEDGSVNDEVLIAALTTFQTGVQSILAKSGAVQQQQQQLQQQEQRQGSTPATPTPALTPPGDSSLKTLQAEMAKAAKSGDKSAYDTAQAAYLTEKAKSVVPSA